MKSELADALVLPREMQYCGRPIVAHPLDFNDLAEMEREFGSLDSFDLGTASVLRFLVWLALRKADATLTDEDRRTCRYNLTREETGRLMPLNRKDEITAFVREYMVFSGLAAAKGEESGNE